MIDIVYIRIWSTNFWTILIVARYEKTLPTILHSKQKLSNLDILPPPSPRQTLKITLEILIQEIVPFSPFFLMFLLVLVLISKFWFKF